MWEGLIERLEAHHRCLAPDLPGFGRSPAPPDFDYSLENLARFTEQFVAASGLAEPLGLVVHDVGGFFGLAWAIRNPQRVRRIAIINTLFFSDYRWHFWGRVWRSRGIGELGMAVLNRWLFRFEVRRGSRRLTREHIDRTYAAYTPAVRRAVLRLYRASDPGNFRVWEDELLALSGRIPTCVLWGEHDPYIPRRFAARFAAGEVHYLPGCGHWPPVEAVDEVAAHLRGFLAAS
jgi:pimeloyl-ACP methyl ester carboxylesterase